MERVEIIEGETPILLVSPHGVDDTNTNYITSKIAEEFETYAILNKGWKRGRLVDQAKEIANCNDIRHLHQDVVKEEFLDPILRNVVKMQRKYQDKILLLIIHGCGDHVKSIADDPNLDLIVGFGDGYPPSYSCNLNTKNAFVNYLQKEHFNVYEGRARGQYSGRSKNNLNQLFNFWYPDGSVNSLQIEITKNLRSSKNIEMTIYGFVNALDSLMLFDDTTTICQNEAKTI